MKKKLSGITGALAVLLMLGLIPAGVRIATVPSSNRIGVRRIVSPIPW